MQLPEHVKAAYIRSLIYSNEEIEVGISKERIRGLANLRVTNVKSPSDFLVETDSPQNYREWEDWREAMQVYYDGNNKVQSAPPILLKDRCYAYKDVEGEGRWERVRVLAYDYASDSAKIYLFEWNAVRNVQNEGFQELANQFTICRADAFPAYLLHVAPAGEEWSEAEIAFFKSAVKGKIFKSLVVERKNIGAAHPCRTVSLGIALLPKSTTQEPALLQQEMVRSGYARCSGIFSATKDLFIFSDRKIPGFRLEDFSGLGKFPLAATVRSALADSIKKAEALREKIRTAKKEVEVVGAAAAADNSKDKATSYRKHIPIVAPGFIPKLFQDLLCRVRISHMYCPSTLYLQMEHTVEELREMEEAINIMVKEEEPLPFIDAKAGTLLAVLVGSLGRVSPGWVRALLRAALPEIQLYKVVLIDYGSECSIPQLNSRALPAQFQNAPAFAFRAHLDVPGVSPSSEATSWSKDAAIEFRKNAATNKKSIPVYYASRPSTAAPIPLQDYNEMVWWLHGSWGLLSTQEVNPINETINAMKEGELLRNLYASVGIELWGEVEAETDFGPFTFVPLVEKLVEKGHATRVPMAK